MRVLKGDYGEILDLAFSPDGRAVAAAVRYHGVCLWNLEAASPSPVRLLTTTGYQQGCLNFSPDSRFLRWATIPGQRIYDRETREYTDHSFAISKTPHSAVTNAEGTRTVSHHGFPEHRLVGWRFAEGEWVRMWGIHTGNLSVSSVALTPDGGSFAMLTRTTDSARWWEQPMQLEVRDTATSTAIATSDYPYTYSGDLRFAPNGQVLVGLRDMTLLVWNLANIPRYLDTPRRVRNDSRKHFTSCAFHPSGKHLFATSNDTTVHVFDTVVWERAGRFSWELGRLKAVCISPDGTLAAAGGDQGDIVIWDVDH